MLRGCCRTKADIADTRTRLYAGFGESTGALGKANTQKIARLS